MKSLKLIIAFLLLLTTALFTTGVTAAPTHHNPTLVVRQHSHHHAHPGSLVTFNVKVSNFPTFGGWDVYVQTNDSILSPVSITVGDFFSSVYNVSNCVNDFGLGCTQFDGPGIAHSSVASLSGNAAGTGVLFSITYVVRSGLGTLVTPFLDVVLDPTGAPIPHLTISSKFGTVGPRDFTMSIGPFNPPLNGIYTVILRAANGFNGTINLTVTASGGVRPVISPSSVSLGILNPGDQALVFLNANNRGTYTITVTGTSGTIIHTVFTTVTI